MSDPNYGYTPNDPKNEQDAGQRINEALETTGKRLQEEVNRAGDQIRTFMEEKHVNEQLEVAGNQVVDRVKSLVEEGNVRRLIIRNPEGRTLLEIPLTAGVAVGGAILWMNPLLAGLGAIAALLTRVNIEIVREEPQATMHDVKQAAEDVGRKLTGGGGASSGGSSGSSGGAGGSTGGSSSGGSGSSGGGTSSSSRSGGSSGPSGSSGGGSSSGGSSSSSGMGSGSTGTSGRSGGGSSSGGTSGTSR